MNQSNLNEIERRPLRHWNVDGLPELLMGLMWLAAAGAYTLGSSRGIFWILLAAMLSAKWFLRRLKERVTYPRAGYVEPRMATRRIAWTVLAAALIGAAIVLVRSTPSPVQQQPSIIVGLVVAGGFVFVARRQGAPHMLWYAAVPPALYVCYYVARGKILPASWMFLAVGGACTVVGAIRFARFLRDNPKQVETGA